MAHLIGDPDYCRYTSSTRRFCVHAASSLPAPPGALRRSSPWRAARPPHPAASARGARPAHGARRGRCCTRASRARRCGLRGGPARPARRRGASHGPRRFGALAADLAAVEVEIDDALGEQAFLRPGNLGALARVARLRWPSPLRRYPRPTAACSRRPGIRLDVACRSPQCRSRRRPTEPLKSFAYPHSGYPPRKRQRFLSYFGIGFHCANGSPHRLPHLPGIRIEPLAGQAIDGHGRQHAPSALLP